MTGDWNVKSMRSTVQKPRDVAEHVHHSCVATVSIDRYFELYL